MASRFQKALRPPRKLIFTRDGSWFTGMTILVGIGAINTGNNLLYLLLGMMLGLIIVSGILSEQSLRKVTVRRLEPGDLFAGRVSRMRYELTNKKRFLASFSLTVQEHEARETRGRRRQHLGLSAERPSKRKLRAAENDPGGPSALGIRVPAARSLVLVSEYMFPRRGLYQYVGLDLGTRFPFGFFEKLRAIYDPTEVLVYPEVRPGTVGIPQTLDHDGEVQRNVEGQHGEFFGLREFRDGDDVRDVNWKVTARRGALVRKLYDKQDDEALAIHLYNWVPPDADEAKVRVAMDALEDAISDAASLCARLIDAGHRFSLHTIDETVSEGAGAGQLQTALRHLALLEIRTDAKAPPLRLSALTNRTLVPSMTTPPHVLGQFSQTSTRTAA